MSVPDAGSSPLSIAVMEARFGLNMQCRLTYIYLYFYRGKINLKIGSSKYIQDIAPALAHWFINDYDEEKNMEIQYAYYERFKTMDDGFKLTRMGFRSLHA